MRIASMLGTRRVGWRRVRSRRAGFLRSWRLPSAKRAGLLFNPSAPVERESEGERRVKNWWYEFDYRAIQYRRVFFRLTIQAQLHCVVAYPAPSSIP